MEWKAGNDMYINLFWCGVFARIEMAAIIIYSLYVTWKNHGKKGVSMLAVRINWDAVTVEDCMDMYLYKKEYVVINDGKPQGFMKEKEVKK